MTQRHPTPAMIRAEIRTALNDWNASHPNDRAPAGLWERMDSAVTAACVEFDKMKETT